MSKAKKFQVRICYHPPKETIPVFVAEEVRSILTGDFYRLLSLFNKTNHIASITIVKIK